MKSKIEWGAEIPVNGMCPAWLREHPICDVKWRFDDGEHRIISIRLPVGHWAYPVIEKGFEPWSGGESAPDDWDKDQPVLFRSGETCANNSWRWEWLPGYDSDYDIIGYRKRAKAGETTTGAAASDDTIRQVSVRSKDEWREYFSQEMNWRSPGVINAGLKLVRSLGLVRENTIVDRFKRETGHEITPAVLAALNWERGHD